MKTNQILMLAGLAVIGFAGYKYFVAPTPPPGYGNAQYIPGGGTWNGYANTTGQPVWVTVVSGVLTAVTAAGQVLATLPWGNIIPGNGNCNAGTGTGSGNWGDNGEGSISCLPL